MLGKLMKHDIQATYRSFALTYVGILAASLLYGAFIFQATGFLGVLSLLVYLGLIFWGFGLTIYQTIKLFHPNLYGRIGYLNLTLPVPTWKLLLSKVLVMMLWFVLTMVIVIVSVFIFLFGTNLHSYLGFNLFDGVVELLNMANVSVWTWVVILLSGFASVFTTITLIGVSMTVVRTGWITKGRDFVSVGIYLLTDFILGYMTRFVQPLELEDALGAGLQQVFITQSLAGMAWDVLWGAIFFALIVYLIDHKLEVE